MSNNTKSRSEEFVLSVTVDFPDDVIYGPFSLKLIDEIMCQIRYMGASRVYWLYYGDVEQDSYWAGNIYIYNGVFTYGPKTISDIGEPLKAAVPIAHRHGLEIYGVIKPYNLGMSGSQSEGSDLFDPNGIQRIGGNVGQVIPFLDKYPHTRMKRKPYDGPDYSNLNIDRIKLLKKDDSPTRIKAENIQIWTSNNNYEYKKIDINPTFKASIEPAKKNTTDYYGETVTEFGQPISTITLDDINIKEKYVLVTTDFQDENGDFINTAVSMIEPYHKSKIIPSEVATLSTVWHRPRNFRTGGLEFDSGFGTLQCSLDSSNKPPEVINSWNTVQRGGIIAVAKGLNDYLPSTPCEMYPEVQTLWDGWVDRVLATGVDGIDIRVSSHGNLVDAPYEYGFDTPTIEKFIDENGYEPSDNQEDKTKLSNIRGSAYTEFIRKSSHKARSLGKEFHFHMHTEAFRENPVHGQILGFPPNITFDWETWVNEKLIDGATFRTSWFEGWEDPPTQTANRQDLNRSLADPVASDALNKLNQNKIPLFLNRYTGRAVGLTQYLDDYESTFNDSRFSGFDVYEFSDLAHATKDGLKLKQRRRQIMEIRKKSIQLGLI